MALTLDSGSSKIHGRGVSPNGMPMPANPANPATAAGLPPGDGYAGADLPGSIGDDALAALERQAVAHAPGVENDWLAYLASLAR